VSGAVVLETQEQYERAGLEAVSGEDSPNIPQMIPEPSGVVLVMLSLAGGLFIRRRRQV